MINLLATGLLSLCLLSPAQSPNCAGGVGVSLSPLPSITLPSPVAPVLPALPPVPPVPAPPVVSHPVPVPAPVLPPVRPVSPPVAPVQAPPAVEAPQPPAPETIPPTVEAPPAAPEITVSATPEPTAPAATSTATTAPERPPYRLPFIDDGSKIGNQVSQFVDVPTLILTILTGLGLIVLNERLDTTPEPKRSPKH